MNLSVASFINSIQLLSVLFEDNIKIPNSYDKAIECKKVNSMNGSYGCRLRR